MNQQNIILPPDSACISQKPIKQIQGRDNSLIYYAQFSWDENQLLTLRRKEKSSTSINIFSINTDKRPSEFGDPLEITSVAFCKDNTKIAICAINQKYIFIKNISNYTVVETIYCDLFDYIDQDKQWLIPFELLGMLKPVYFETIQLGPWTSKTDIFKKALILQKNSLQENRNPFYRSILLKTQIQFPLTMILHIRKKKIMRRIFFKPLAQYIYMHESESLYFTESTNQPKMRNHKGKLIRSFVDSRLQFNQAKGLYICTKSDKQIGLVNITTGVVNYIDISQVGCIAASRQHVAVQNKNIIEIYKY